MNSTGVVACSASFAIVGLGVPELRVRPRHRPGRRLPEIKLCELPKIESRIQKARANPGFTPVWGEALCFPRSFPVAMSTRCTAVFLQFSDCANTSKLV